MLTDYGTGIVIGVPAHDERDFAFAKDIIIPYQQVVSSPSIEYTDEGKLAKAYHR